MPKKDYKMNAAEMFLSDTDPEDLQEEKQEELQPAFAVPEGYRLVKEYKSERMQLLVKPATKKAIKKAAYSQGMSMNDLINKIIEEYIERQG
jgi:predicted HicB family RNase H-like nuclease